MGSGGINDSPHLPIYADSRTSHLRPLGLNDKLYARKTRVKKIKKHAFLA